MSYSYRPFPLTICWSVCLPVHCGKTADRIRMPYGMVGRTGPGMRQVAGFWDPSTKGNFGENMACTIVTNGEFPILGIPTAPLLGWCDVTASASTQKSRVVLWAGLARRVASTSSNAGTWARSRAIYFICNENQPHSEFRSTC